MKHTMLPGTDLSVSRLSFGTASLHHLPTSSQRRALLATAFDHGFTHLDTASYNGFGLAEVEVGRFSRRRNNQLTVASKVGLHPPGGQVSTIAGLWARKALGKIAPVLSRPIIDWSVAAASRSLESSLRRLGRDCIENWLAEHQEHETPQLPFSGYIRSSGCSLSAAKLDPE